MVIKFDSSGTIKGLKNLLDDLLSRKNIKSLLILGANNYDFTAEALNPVLRSSKVPVIGGLYSAVIYNQQVYHRGTIVVGLSVSIKSTIVPNLSTPGTDYDETVSTLIDDNSIDCYDTIFVFADGYSSQIADLTESLFTVFGITCNFIGGGAGYYHPEKEMKSKPCVLTNDGIIEDSAILGMARLNSKVELKHGWKKISNAYRVTESEGKAINSIDWQPCFEFYTQFIENHSGKKVTRNNFFDIGRSYSLGLSRLGSDIIVREPIGIDGDSLLFTVPVPNESIVYILNGNTKNMVKAAKQATDLCTNELKDREGCGIFVVDCVSRYYFQGSDFKKELKAISQKKLPLFGVLSIGEIANSGKNYIELYNKTCVIGVIKG